MTTLELAREEGYSNSSILQIINRALKRRCMAGFRPIEVVAQEHIYGRDRKTIYYELTPHLMRTLYHHPPAFSAIWQTIYDKHPEWVPDDRARAELTPASMRLEREELLEARRRLHGAYTPQKLIEARLYGFERAARKLRFADGYALRAWLRDLRLLRRRYTLWVLLPPYDARGYTQTVTMAAGRKGDDKTPIEVTVWTERGLQFLARLKRKHPPQNASDSYGTNPLPTR